MTSHTTERQKKRQVQVDAIHQSIGEFAVSFEQVSAALRRGILHVLQNRGLGDQDVVHILLAKHAAYDLNQTLRSLISHALELGEEDQRVVSYLFSRHLLLLESRNNILHAEWFIGWGNESTEDWSMGHGMKEDRNSKGVNLKAFNWKVDEFKALTAEAEYLWSCFVRLSGCIALGYEFANNFTWSNDGSLLPEAARSE